MSNKSIETNKLRLIWELPLSGAHHTAVQSYSFKRWAVTCTFVVLWLGRLIWSNSKHSLHYWQSAHVLWRTSDNPLTNLIHNLQFALLAFVLPRTFRNWQPFGYILVNLMHLVGLGFYVMLFGRTWCFFLFCTANKRRLSEFNLIQHGEYFQVMRPLFKHWQYSQNHRQRNLQIWKSKSDCTWELLPPSLNILKKKLSGYFLFNYKWAGEGLQGIICLLSQFLPL